MSENINSSKLGLRLTVLILCILLAVSGYYIVFNSKYGILAQYQINRNMQLQINRLNIQVSQLKKSQHSDIGYLEQLDKRQSRLESNLNSFSDMKNFKLIELDIILNTANQNLITYNNVENAFKLLSVADKLIATESGVEFESLQISIKQDIERLQVTKTTINLSSVNQNINKLDLLANKLVLKSNLTRVQSLTNSANIESNQNTLGGLGVFWHGLKQSLSSMIKVTKLSESGSNTVITNQNDSKLNQSADIKLLVGLIEMALMSHNQELWLLNLNNLQQLISVDYQVDLNSEEALGIIQALKIINLSDLGNENINQTITILNQLLQKQK